MTDSCKAVMDANTNTQTQPQDETPSRGTKQNDTGAQSPTVVLIESDDEDDPANSNNSNGRQSVVRKDVAFPEEQPTAALYFGVSKNSGRISLYDPSTMEPLHVNFDFADILSDTTIDAMESSQTDRTRGNLSHLYFEIQFKKDGVKKGTGVYLDMESLLRYALDALPCSCIAKVY